MGIILAEITITPVLAVVLGTVALLLDVVAAVAVVYANHRVTARSLARIEPEVDKLVRKTAIITERVAQIKDNDLHHILSALRDMRQELAETDARLQKLPCAEQSAMLRLLDHRVTEIEGWKRTGSAGQTSKS